MSATPSLDAERELLTRHRVIAGMDEVGRGALAGPVCVGVVALTMADGLPEVPAGLRDSKELTVAARGRLAEPLRSWGAGWGLGWASPREIDVLGIVEAMRRAALRALAASGLAVEAVLLDGRHDYLTNLTLASEVPVGSAVLPAPYEGNVMTRIKADRDCAAVAAASVLAKCSRDQLMTRVAAEHPGYGWERNAGYGTAEHLAALRRLGPSSQHRISWRLPPQAQV